VGGDEECVGGGAWRTGVDYNNKLCEETKWKMTVET
jgi:hypothetical protein